MYVAIDYGRNANHIFNSALDSYVIVWSMSVRSIRSTFEALDTSKYKYFGWVVFFFCVVLTAIVCINMLIASFFSTYDRVTENKNEWLRQVS